MQWATKVLSQSGDELLSGAGTEMTTFSEEKKLSGNSQFVEFIQISAASVTLNTVLSRSNLTDS